ncbi:unnamed protein product [Eruca vesicaria subsp. sativa]|uniref:Uncharacterized protein n=1 Tax=Eruca vesicaria subsp. sativa TaxID=29727 RepID=A0ABC8JQR5_ERUVS|nr:unnamed protein product [Eruca vesicaria subsp. sativa]
MQDFSYPMDSFSPSFSFYVSGDGKIVEAAVRVVRESQSYGDDTAEFEFETLPLREENFFHFPTTKGKQSLAAVDDGDTSKNLLYGGWMLDQSISSPSQSHSSEDSEGDLSPGRYSCFWSPSRSPARGDSSKTKSKSTSGPRRCRIKDLLRRSHSDGAVSATSETKRCRFKDLLRRSHSDGRVSGSSSTSPVERGNSKTTSNKYTSNTGEVNMRRKTYLPYRQDLIGVFAGMSRLSR